MFSFAFWRKVTIESKYFGGLFLKVSYFQSSRQCLSNSHVTLNHLGGLVKSADSGLAGLSPAHPWPRPPAAPTSLRTADLQARVAQDTGMWSQIYLTSSASVLESQMNALHISSSLMFLIVLFSILMGFFFFSSFDSKFVYQQRGLGPIEEDTILVIDPNHAAILQSSGKNLWVKLLMFLKLVLPILGVKCTTGSGLRKSVVCNSGEKVRLKKA